MTIDKSIEYELNGGVVPPTKYIQVYREQIIEWLEELKSLRSASELWEHNNNIAYAQGRHDAIDEFMKAMEEWDKRVAFIRDECAFFTISNIRDMAEQIKAKSNNSFIEIK